MKKTITGTFLIMMMCLLLCGCSKGTSSVHATQGTVQKESSSEADKDSEGLRLGIIKKIDTAGKTITFWDYDERTTVIFSYNEGTSSYTRSGTPVTLDQLSCGMAVDIYYLEKSDIITRIQVSQDKDVWVNSKVTSFSVDDVNQSFKIGQSLYKYTDNTLIYSDGKEITLRELNSEDQLTVYGKGTEILSVIVDKGHGYVTLRNENYFIGGYINIGSRVARQISDGMLLIVQEGTYTANLKNGEYNENRQITVKRNERTVIDLSNVAPAVQKTGSVRFNIDVENAVLYIDGKTYDPSEIITLSTGDHTIMVTADGYDDYTSKLHVGQNYSVIDIRMTSGSGGQALAGEEESVKEQETKETGDSTGETTQTSEETETESKPHGKYDTVTVSGPEGGFIYFDGKYMGTAPVTFDLVEGTHVISVLKDSQIKSYTVNLEGGADPVTYDFTEK